MIIVFIRESSDPTLLIAKAVMWKYYFAIQDFYMKPRDFLAV